MMNPRAYSRELLSKVQSPGFNSGDEWTVFKHSLPMPWVSYSKWLVFPSMASQFKVWAALLFWLSKYNVSAYLNADVLMCTLLL